MAFHAFYKYGSFIFGVTGIVSVDEKIRGMLSKVQAKVNRGEGTLNWCISKFLCYNGGRSKIPIVVVGLGGCFFALVRQPA